MGGWNKRTGLGLALFLIARSGWQLKAEQEELYQVTIKVAEGKISTEELQEWIDQRLARPA